MVEGRILMIRLPLAKTLKRHELRETLGIALVVALGILGLSNPRLVLGALNDVVLTILAVF